jgi:dihydrofolate reductase
MAKVIAIMSMSLDGYVADRNGGVSEVMRWYMNSGDTEVQTGGSDPMKLKMSEASASHFRDLTSQLGSVLTGRRTFETADGWGGNHAWGPAFVLTHRIPHGMAATQLDGELRDRRRRERREAGQSRRRREVRRGPRR